LSKVKIALLISLAITCQAYSQDISLEEILNRTRNALMFEKDQNQDLMIEHTEKFISAKVDENGESEKADTTIARVVIQGENEISREVIYTTEDNKKKKSEDKGTLKDFIDELTIDSPKYKYALIESTGDEYVVSVTPRKEKPDKGQIEGKYYIDKNTFLLNSMDFIVPRPDKLKELTMRFDFQRLDNGLYVTQSMFMLGRVRILFGVIDIRFKVDGEFYDYKVVETVE
jgi:hypothetical protein